MVQFTRWGFVQFLEKVRIPEKIKKFVWEHRQTLLECLIVFFSALWVGRAFLNFNANDFVEGREFALSTVSHLFGRCSISADPVFSGMDM
jgi:hypothetical protein